LEHARINIAQTGPLPGKKRFFVMAVTAPADRPCHDAFVGSGETTMKDILFSVVMSLVLFFAVSYVHRAKAEPCIGNNCTHIEEIVTLPQSDGSGGCTGSGC